MTPSSRVIVVGAGPVGLALAMSLVRHGVQVTILEAQDQLCPESRAPGILPRTLEVFRAWGLLELMLQAGTFLSRVQGVRADTNQIILELDLPRVLDGITPTPGLLVLPQDQTVRFLADALQKSPLAELRMGHRVVGIDPNTSERVTLEVAPKHKAPYRLAGEFVVGCDGARSVVRQACGWELEGKTYASRLVLADVRLARSQPLPWPRLLRSAQGGALGALRMSDGVWRLIIVLAKTEDTATVLRPESITAYCQLLLGAPPQEQLWASAFRIHCRTSPHFYQGRILLAGDAAHINSPIGGQGMNSGIQDAHNLGWKLALCLAGGDCKALLASYESERRGAVINNVARYTDLLTRFLLQGNRTTVNLFGRWVAKALSGRSPRFTRRLAARATMLDTRYATSPCLVGHHRLRGRRAPDGELETQMGRQFRFFDLIDPDGGVVLFSAGALAPSYAEDLQAAAEFLPVYTIHKTVEQQLAHPSNPYAFSDPTKRLWQAWKAHDGLVAVVRPDGHIGWAARRPEPEALAAALKRIYGGARPALSAATPPSQIRASGL